MSLIMDYMSRDHDRLDGIFGDFQKFMSENPEEARRLFSEFEKGLRRHIIWEEEILFPAFEEQTGMKKIGPTAVMRMEHQKIKASLDQIRQKVQGSNLLTGNEEKYLIGILTAHNQKEEQILYPWIDRSIGEKTRAEMIVEMEKKTC